MSRLTLTTKAKENKGKQSPLLKIFKNNSNLKFKKIYLCKYLYTIYKLVFIKYNFTIIKDYSYEKKY